MSKRVSSGLRNCDHFFGIPLIYILGKLRKRKPIPKEIQKIGLLHTAAIGDTVLLSGPITDLKTQFPRAEIIFFSGPSNFETAQFISGIQVVKLPVTKVAESISLIRNQSFDLWIDFGQWARINALYSYFVKAKFKIGFKTKGQYRHFIYDKTADHKAIHEIDNYRALLKSIGIESKSPPVLSFPPLKSEETTIVIHMHPGGSRAYLKQWPEKNWVELIDRLLDRGFQIQLTGCPADREASERIKASCKSSNRIELLAGMLKLRETALILQKAHSVISVDTGIMHLAAALGCHTIALHGPTSPKRWGGIGPNVHPIVPKMNYTPCIHLGFENCCSTNRCMRAITVDEVFEVIASQKRADEPVEGHHGNIEYSSI